MLPDYLTFNAPTSFAHWLTNHLPGGWNYKQSTTITYAEVRRLGGITISMPAYPERPAHIEIKGNGCRELEAAGIVTDWQAFLRGLLDTGAKFSRLDCAIDDKAGVLNLEQIIVACKEGRVVSAYDAADPRPKFNPGTGQITGNGVTFGHRKSLTFIRVYDKSLEMDAPGHWVRVEVEAKKKRAQALAIAIAKQGANIVPSFLLGLLDFKTKEATNGRNRSKTEGWWTRFLGTKKVCRLEIAPRNVSQENTYNWLIRSVSPSLARLYDSGMGDGLITEMLVAGRQKLERLPVEKSEKQGQQVDKDDFRNTNLTI